MSTKTSVKMVIKARDQASKKFNKVGKAAGGMRDMMSSILQVLHKVIK